MHMDFKKKGQNWSLEAMIAINIFAAVVIISFFLINYIPQDNSRDIVKSSDDLNVKIENDLKILNGNQIDKGEFQDLTEISAQELGQRLGVQGDVCISLKTLDGKEISGINSSVGIGNDSICGN